MTDTCHMCGNYHDFVVLTDGDMITDPLCHACALEWTLDRVKCGATVKTADQAAFDRMVGK